MVNKCQYVNILQVSTFIRELSPLITEKLHQPERDQISPLHLNWYELITWLPDMQKCSHWGQKATAYAMSLVHRQGLHRKSANFSSIQLNKLLCCNYFTIFLWGYFPPDWYKALPSVLVSSNRVQPCYGIYKYWLTQSL